MDIKVGRAAIAEASDKLSNWGRWGKDDQIGTLNHVGPPQVYNAAKLVKKGRVYLNGSRKPQKEPFIRPDPSCGICNLPKTIKIPPGHFFMMGDNRGESADSREWGPVPKKWIIGEAFFTYWPLDRIGTL